MSATLVAFACWYLCGVETVVAFAGLKWAILVRFWVAEVTVVSMGAVQGRALVTAVSTRAVQGRAVVTAVSCWPASVVAEVSLVSISPRRRVLRAKKFALLGLMVGVSVTKFAQHAKNG